MIAAAVRAKTETGIIAAVDRIVDEIERALLDENETLAGELHAAVVGTGVPAGEREDRVLDLAWRISSGDNLLRRAS